MLEIVWKLIIDLNRFMKKNKIIISIIALLFLSITFLYYRAENMSEPKWWAVYFSDAKNSNSDFVIENQGETRDFYWQVLDGTTKIYEGDVRLEEDEVKSFKLDEFEIINKKLIVRILSGEEKREIYKTIN